MARSPSSAAPFARRLARALRNIHVADLGALAIVGGLVLDGSAKLLSAPNPLVQLVLVIACTAAAAKRLVAWRHGKGPPISIERPSQTIAIVAGVAPWFLLPLFHQPLHEWPLWAPIAFPPALRVIGACLMVSGMFGPLSLALGGLFLLSSSPFVGVLVAGCLGHAAVRRSSVAPLALTAPAIEDL